MDPNYRSCILLLNLPESALAGIDLLSFTTTPRFQGIKNLPPGFHFVFASATSALTVRQGVWFRTNPSDPAELPDPIVKKWDATQEELVSETNAAATKILRDGAGFDALWRERLTPYRQSAGGEGGTATEEDTHDWSMMTDCISETLLARITGGRRNHWALTSASSAARDLDDIPGLSKEQNAVQPDRELGFLPVDLKRTWREGATGRERTEAARDWSWALADLVDRFCEGKNEMEVLGEMQFAFLMVLTLNNYSCLEQWKRIMRLLFGCTAVVKRWPALFVRAVSTLRLQLRHCDDVEGGLFDLSEEGAPLLKVVLRKFKVELEVEFGKEIENVTDELDDLETFLRDEYGWDLNEPGLEEEMIELEDAVQVVAEEVKLSPPKSAKSSQGNG